MHPSIHLWLLTAPGRSRILASTLRSLRQSDCPPPLLFTDAGDRALPAAQRILLAFHAMLTAAVRESDAAWLLCMEDDIAVSRHLLHNITAWPPLNHGRIRTFASLYNATLIRAPRTRPARTWFRADPR